MSKTKPIKKSKLIWVVAAIIYVLSPIDLIPEFFPFIGEIDDIAVILALLWQIVKTFGLDEKIKLGKDKPVNDSKEVIDAEILNEDD